MTFSNSFSALANAFSADFSSALLSFLSPSQHGLSAFSQHSLSALSQLFALSHGLSQHGSTATT